MSDAEVDLRMDGVCAKLYWLGDCVKEIDVANVGKRVSILDYVKEACSRHEDADLELSDAIRDERDGEDILGEPSVEEPVDTHNHNNNRDDIDIDDWEH